MREKPCRIISFFGLVQFLYERKGYSTKFAPFVLQCVCVCIPVGRCELVITTAVTIGHEGEEAAVLSAPQRLYLYKLNGLD